MDQALHSEPAGISGLSEKEALERLKHFGPNRIPEQRRHPALVVIAKFWGPIPWLLEATVLTQLALGRRAEALVIGLLLALNAAISLLEEGRARGALDLLRHTLVTRARVLRDGSWRTVPAESLVPGDLVHLRMGDLSPADIRLVEGELLLDQSALTGESVAVEAGPGSLAYAAAPVRRGEATGEVIATGTRTYFGHTAELVRTVRAQSHLSLVIFRIVRILVVIDLALIAILLAYALATAMPLRDVISFALVLLVASVPVALPATFTLATALGSTELARSGVLLTRLATIEEAAGMDVLCTDKTGTLTENRLTLSGLEGIGGTAGDDVLRLAALACDAASQDAIDMAILAAAEAKGLATTQVSRLGFDPFDPGLRYSVGHYREGDHELWVAKGAPSAVAGLVGEATDASVATARLALTGARILAVAVGESRSSLRLGGLVALEDPPRPDSVELVSGLRDLGIRVLMVTGDNLATAVAIAQRVGIEGPGATGASLQAMSADEALANGVYARVFPEQKIALVRLLQKAGHVVGMTGDGVNDAPALRQADVGIAVASATDVARAAAGIALTTPGLVDALTAVRISRRIYQRMLTYTINKIMKTLEIAVFLTIGVMLTHTLVITPLLIVLLLFTNDFVTMSIATDRVGFSKRPDRWNVRRLMLTGAGLAASVLVLSFAVFFVARDVLALPLAQLQTVVFVMLVATGQGNVYLVRERDHFWRSRPSRWLIFSSLADLVVVGVMAATGTLMAPISIGVISLVLVVVALYLLVIDQVKVVIFRRMWMRNRDLPA